MSINDKTPLASLTPERTLELLREVVAEHGEDFVYHNPDPEGDCLYVHGDKPGCLAGHVYHRAGVALYQLSAREGQGANAAVFTDARSSFGLGINMRSADLLRQAQSCQDEGFTWGEALAAAEREYARTVQAQED